jgi:uncharacterized membrane protein YuzA (DUF378 family)
MPQFTLNHAVLILLIAGALNWGLVAVGQDDIVHKFVPQFEQPIKLVIGVAGLYQLYLLISEFTA